RCNKLFVCLPNIGRNLLKNLKTFFRIKFYSLKIPNHNVDNSFKWYFFSRIFFERNLRRGDDQFFIRPVFFKRGIASSFHVRFLQNKKRLRIKIFPYKELLCKKNIFTSIC